MVLGVALHALTIWIFTDKKRKGMQAPDTHGMTQTARFAVELVGSTCSRRTSVLQNHDLERNSRIDWSIYGFCSFITLPHMM